MPQTTIEDLIVQFKTFNTLLEMLCHNRLSFVKPPLDSFNTLLEMQGGRVS